MSDESTRVRFEDKQEIIEYWKTFRYSKRIADFNASRACAFGKMKGKEYESYDDLKSFIIEYFGLGVAEGVQKNSSYLECTVLQDNDFIHCIFMNEKRMKGDQKIRLFCLAHELGHYINWSYDNGFWYMIYSDPWYVPNMQEAEFIMNEERSAWSVMRPYIKKTMLDHYDQHTSDMLKKTSDFFCYTLNLPRLSYEPLRT